MDAKGLLNKYGLPSEERYGKNDIKFIVDSEMKEAQKELFGFIRKNNLCNCTLLEQIYRPCNLCEEIKKEFNL